MSKNLENISRLVYMATQYKYKLGTHRNNRRLWLEGNRLSSHGFVKDKRYNLRYATNCIMIEFDEFGTHKINGTDKRPIIDICNMQVGRNIKTDNVMVTFDVDNLIIEGIENET